MARAVVWDETGECIWYPGRLLDNSVIVEPIYTIDAQRCGQRHITHVNFSLLPNVFPWTVLPHFTLPMFHYVCAWTYIFVYLCGSKVGSIVFGCTQFISAGSPVPQTRTQWSQWSCPLFQQSITAVLKYSLQDSWTRTVFSCLWLSVQLSFMPAPRCFDWMENHIYEQRWSRREVARVPHLSTGCRRGFKFCLTNLPSVCTHCW